MANPIHPKSGYEKWQDSIRLARCNPKWADHDVLIKQTVKAFNEHLKATPGYASLDWQLIKAMLWTETGAGVSLWNSKPMQIGMYNDPGLDELLSGDRGSKQILPVWTTPLTKARVIATPLYNIRAGVGYLLFRLANYEFKEVLDKDTNIYEVTVKAGDSFSKLTRAQGSTVATMQKLNPGVQVLRPGQTLKYQKASTQWVIIGWRALSTANVAAYYNGGGDPNYAKKLAFALSVIKMGNIPPCTP